MLAFTAGFEFRIILFPTLPELERAFIRVKNEFQFDEFLLRCQIEAFREFRFLSKSQR